MTVEYDDNEERPVLREDGHLWDALDVNGYGHTLGYSSKELVQAWLAGYRMGAEENM